MTMLDLLRAITSAPVDQCARCIGHRVYAWNHYHLKPNVCFRPKADIRDRSPLIRQRFVLSAAAR